MQVTIPPFSAGSTYNPGTILQPGGPGTIENGLLYTQGSGNNFARQPGGPVIEAVPTYALGSTGVARMESLTGRTSDMYFVFTTGATIDNSQIFEGLTMDTATGQVGLKYGAVIGAGITFHDGSYLPSGSDLVRTVNGETGDVLVTPSQVAHFTIQASSSIGTGAKTSALHRIPYAAKVTEIGVRTGITGGITATFRKIKNGDLFDMSAGVSNSIVVGTVNAAAAAFGATTAVNSIDGPNYVYMNIDGIASGITLVQGFMEYIRFDGAD